MLEFYFILDVNIEWDKININDNC